MARDPAIYRVYVDESGDRGWSAKSSPVFLLAALIVPDHFDSQLRDVRDQLCIDLGKPTATVLHWAANIKNHSQRKYVAKTLAQEKFTLVYVVIDKASFGGSPGGLLDHSRMYNYAIRRLFERISWFLRDRNAIGHIALAQITKFKYETLRNYLAILRNQQTTIQWQHFAGPPKIYATTDRVLLQLADIAAGALSAAISPDPFGAVEPAYLVELAPRIYRRPPGAITTYGLHVLLGPALLHNQAWWGAFPA